MSTTTQVHPPFWKAAGWHDRIVPGLWVIAVSVLVIALPGPASCVALALISGIAFWELLRLLNPLRLRGKRMVSNAYFAMAYVVIPLGVLAWAHTKYGAGMAAYLIWLAFVSDTVAYYAGKRYGRIHFAPRVSPNKTLEGVVCGMLAAMLLGLIFAGLHWVHASVLVVCSFSGILAVGGVGGDLFESLLKRRAGAKDSGKLLRGHGGVFDRIDALLAILLVAWSPLAWGWLH